MNHIEAKINMKCNVLKGLIKTATRFHSVNSIDSNGRIRKRNNQGNLRKKLCRYKMG